MTKIAAQPRRVKPHPDQGTLRRLFAYDSESGRLTWLTRPRTDFRDDLQWKAWNGHHAGKYAGSKRGGYFGVGIGEVSYLAHRLIWIWSNGPIPDGYLIDHIDGNGLNNRLDNLRLVTNAENQKNLKPQARSNSGVRGVYYRPGVGYLASVRRNGKLVHLGCFRDLAKAKRVADAARAQEGYSMRHLNR